jgi:ABC-2 type transport system permease protein
MLKVLLKKQIAEVFRSYFYDAKKNRMRSKKAIAAWIIFFLVVMIGLLGGIFTGLSLSVCETLVQLDMGWLYFLLMGGIAVMLGAFGSVFNTYSGLYLAKDNDLLLSLPIPVRTIMTARLLNVWLMGSMYSAVVLVPALAVYWVKAGASVSRIICGLLLLVIVTVIVLLLSCVLGWVVAKISVRLKNRSFITVFISLFFVGAYYFFYFKANGFIREFLLNAVSYGEKIKGAARGLYLFGRIGEGDWPAAGIFTAGAGILFLLVWQVMSRTFLSIAAAGGKT